MFFLGSVALHMIVMRVGHLCTARWETPESALATQVRKSVEQHLDDFHV